MGYLDKAGLAYLWGKINAALVKKQDAASAVTMEQVNEAIQAAVSAGGGAGEAPEKIYSTQEQVIGRWIDNRPLYRKTVEKTGIYLDGRGIEFLIVMEDCRIHRWHGYIDEGNFWYPLTYNMSDINTEQYMLTCVTGNGQNLMLQSGLNIYMSNATAVFTIEYTKDADQPVSPTGGEGN